MQRLLLLFSLGCSFYWASAQNLTSFTLIDAATDTPIGTLADGDTINLNITGNSLNIVVEYSGTLGSVRFALDGDPNFQTENVPPYAMAGNNGADYDNWTPALGNHQLTARAYAESNANGALLDELGIDFVVVNETPAIDPPLDPGTGAVTINGELKQWHKITLDFDGPAYAETDMSPNPFLDYCLEVTFTNGAHSYRVPGYFAADGEAANTSSNVGNVWRVHFAPDTLGEWTYTASFRLGAAVAVSEDMEAGEPLAPIDGTTGTFTIEATDKCVPDNRARGRLEYVGERYLRYASSGEYFIKGGADAPENLLAYEDFDNTPNYGNRRKSYSPHAGDWLPGNPSWQDGKGTELIGALNYLAGKGVNVFSFLPMNIQGDDRNVFPYVTDTDFLHFDCSKLDQWEIVFAHAETLGFYLHFKTQETENDQLLDGGAVGLQRKLYYRELLARFGHHLALNWNMGEENTQTPAQRLDMAAWWAEHDPYQHNRVIHTYPNQTDQVYNPLLGDASEYTGVSIQTGWNNVHSETAKWVARSIENDKPWIVANDEQGGANLGVPPDPGYPGYNGSNPDLHAIRRDVLWGNLMAGGAGVEYYFGYQQPDSDLTLQNFRSRDQTWIYVNHALNFFRSFPFHLMAADDDLTPNGWCFAQIGERYIVYQKEGGEALLELPDEAVYLVRWYNPRTGVYLDGSVMQVNGPGQVSLGTPPIETAEDWATLVERQGEPEACSQTYELFSRDFPYTDSDFYLDDFTGQELLAIDPNQADSALVQQAFGQEACLYNLVFHGVGENDGESSFRLRIDGEVLADFSLPLSTEPWAIGPMFNRSFPNLLLADTTQIEVLGRIHSADGQEYSRARWLKLSTEPAVEAAAPYELTLIVGDGWELLPGAQVTLTDGTVGTTDEAGSVTFTGLTPATIHFNVSAAGYEARTDSVALASDLTRLLRLQPAVVSVRETPIMEQLMLMPNPARDWVRLTGWDSERADIQVWTADGRLYRRLNDVSAGAVLPLANYQSGVYFIFATASQAVYRAVLVVE